MVTPEEFGLAYRRHGRDVVVEIRGELDMATAPHLQRGLADLIDDQGNQSIVIDLRDLAFIDSSGLTVLARAQSNAHAHGGALLLEHLRPNVKRVLEISGLLSLFRVREAASDDSHTTAELVEKRTSVVVDDPVAPPTGLAETGT